MRCDVAVVGGGVAGLAAARDLSTAGLSVVLLEARPRLGGRILTLRDPAWPRPVELGAEFLHGAAEPLQDDLRAAGLAPVLIPDVHVTVEADTWKPSAHYFERIEKLIGRGPGGARDRSIEEVLRRQRLPRPLLDAARMFVEGYHAAHTDRVSARSLQSVDSEGDDDAQARLAEGYGELVRHVAAGTRARVLLNAIVHEVAWSRGAVRVRAHGVTGDALPVVQAQAAVIALPIGVLKAPAGATGAVRFDPAIPGLDETLKGFEFGAVVKLALRFRTSFWNEPGFVAKRQGRAPQLERVGIDFFHRADAAFPTWWTWAPVTTRVLVGWAGGPAAERLAGLSEPELLSRALDALASVLLVDRRTVARELEGWATHDWVADPFSRGAYASIAVGGTAAPRRLARPVQRTLFFAGEALDTDEAGTVPGAFDSGRKAAARVRKVLRA